MTQWFFLSAVLFCSQFCFAQQPAKNSEAATNGLSAYEQHKQAAIRINELAGRIRSEADANARRSGKRTCSLNTNAQLNRPTNPGSESTWTQSSEAFA